MSLLRSALLAAVALPMMATGALAGTNLITNGTFTNTTATVSYGGNTIGTSITNSNLSGWQITSCLAINCFSSAPSQTFVNLATSNVGTAGIYQSTPALGGGAVINFDSAPTPFPVAGSNAITSDAGNEVAALYQSVSGLTVGDTYSLSFYQATMQATQGNQGAFTAAWNVYFGTGAASNAETAASFTSASMSNPGTTYTPWNLVTTSFVATSATETLSFFATASGGQPPFLLLDGVSLTDVGPSVQSAVPEPASMALLGAGALGMLAARRKRAAKAA